MNWSRTQKTGLVLSFLICNLHAKGKLNDSLLNQVDTVLQQIDSNYNQHGSHADHQAAVKKEILEKAPTKTVEFNALKKQSPQIVEAKQQIDLAETEIAKLKQAINTIEAEDIVSREDKIQRIVRLNKGLIQTYDKTLHEYQAQGLKDSTYEVQQLKKGIEVAQNEINTFSSNHDHSNFVNNSYTSNQRSPVRESAESIIERREFARDDMAYESHSKSAKGFVHGHGRGNIFALSDFKFTPFGFIKYEPFYHTRQLLGIEGTDQIFLLPALRLDDANFQDINARGSFQLTYLAAHLGLLVEGPHVLGAKPYADFSMMYYGPLGVNYVQQDAVHAMAATHGFLMIHSAIYIDWPCTSLIFGQTWLPWVDPEIMVSRERVTTIGALAEPLSRRAQMRFTQHFTEYMDMIFAVYGFIDEKARTNIGIEHEQLQNVPAYGFHAQLRFNLCDNIFALGADIQTVKPRLFDEFCLTLDQQIEEAFDNLVLAGTPCEKTRHILKRTGDFKTNAGVTSFSMFAFAKLVFESVTVRGKMLIGSNVGVPLGGYAVKQRRMEVSVVNGADIPQNPLTCYTPMRLASGVFDISVPRTIEPGIFFGFTKNLGSDGNLYRLPEMFGDLILSGNERYLIYRLRPDLDYTVTISPRVKYHADPLTFGGEIEFQRASYGQICSNGTIQCGIPVDDIRFIATVEYLF